MTFQRGQIWRERQALNGHRRRVKLLTPTRKLGEAAWTASVINRATVDAPSKMRVVTTILRESVLRMKWEQPSGK